MCDFCKKNSEIEMVDKERRTILSLDKNDKTKLNIEIFSNNFNFSSIKINNCLFCGENLSKEN